jgi:hypothetical protein
MWWPVFAFVALGLEHVVANMFFIPIGLFLGAPELTVGLYIWKGTFPEDYDVVFVVVIAHCRLCGRNHTNRPGQHSGRRRLLWCVLLLALYF